MSSWCLPMRESSRSKGPSNSPTPTENPTVSGTPPGASEPAGGATTSSGAVLPEGLGDGTARHELASEPAVPLRRVVLRGEGQHRDSGNRGVRELDGAADHRVQDARVERLDHTL